MTPVQVAYLVAVQRATAKRQAEKEHHFLIGQPFPPRAK